MSDEKLDQYWLTLPWWVRHWQRLGWALFVGFNVVALLAVKFL